MTKTYRINYGNGQVSGDLTLHRLRQEARLPHNADHTVDVQFWESDGDSYVKGWHRLCSIFDVT